MFAYFDVAENCAVYEDGFVPDYLGTRVDLSESDIARLQDDNGRLQPSRWARNENGTVVFREDLESLTQAAAPAQKSSINWEYVRLAATALISASLGAWLF